MPDDQHTFTIFGAGLAGPLMAIYLARAGYRVRLYEKRPDPRKDGSERGRSINLALSTRGIDALERVGLAQRVLDGAIPMPGRMIHSRAGELSFQPYSRDRTNAINSVSRSALNIALLDAAQQHEGVEVHFASKCVDVDFDSGRASVLNAITNETSEVDTQHIIGADGAFSAVRSAMQKADKTSVTLTPLEHGYKELTIPHGPGGHFFMEKHALHIWPRGSYMMIALPNADGSFTCTLFWPLTGPNSFASLQTDEEILAFFREHFGDAIPLLPNLVSEFRSNPTGSLTTVRCVPWNVTDRAVLIGDAAHAIVPFYGQGMNASFEDCVWLDRCLTEHASDINAAFEQFSTSRKPHADAIADLALANFIEMRDKTARAGFRARKWLDRMVLTQLFPEEYVPLYEMVSFSTEPYADVVQRAKRQDAFVARAIAGLAVGLAVVVLGSALFWLINR